MKSIVKFLMWVAVGGVIWSLLRPSKKKTGGNRLNLSTEGKITDNVFHQKEDLQVASVASEQFRTVEEQGGVTIPSELRTSGSGTMGIQVADVSILTETVKKEKQNLSDFNNYL